VPPTITDLGNTGGGRPPSAVINTNNPAGASTGINTFEALVVPGNFSKLGSPVRPSLSQLGQVDAAEANSAVDEGGVLPACLWIGLLVVVGDRPPLGPDQAPCTVQTSGVVTLATTLWDAIVTGESGGLTPGAYYYLSSTHAGFLVTTPPSAANSFVTLIGLALSATELLLMQSGSVGPHA
jgi:hypothetical protein